MEAEGGGGGGFVKKIPRRSSHGANLMDLRDLVAVDEKHNWEQKSRKSRPDA